MIPRGVLGYRGYQSRVFDSSIIGSMGVMRVRICKGFWDVRLRLYQFGHGKVSLPRGVLGVHLVSSNSCRYTFKMNSHNLWDPL
jgi:hypothetical protein